MLNSITIMGRLTDDPVFRQLPTGTHLATFTLACERNFSYKGDEKQTTDFIDVSAWRGNADFVAKNFRKGSMVVVSGRLQSRKWQDRDGNNRTSWEINVDNVYFGESRRDSSDGNYEAPRANAYDSNRSGGYDGGRSSYEAPRTVKPANDPFVELNDDDGELPF